MMKYSAPLSTPSTLSMRAAGGTFCCLGVLAIILYWPGLRGGFAFDDLPFVVNNTDVHVTSLRLGDWVHAALSFPAGHQGRWLTMLSFAANYYFAGLDPFWLKLTNLGIHVLNGLVLFLLLRALFDLRGAVREPATRYSADRAQLVAAVVAGAWLLLPINVTAVLYVTQRLESLCTLFVLLGLWLYLRARLKHYQGNGGRLSMWASLAGFTFLGLLAKESAVLLPLFAFCVEFALPRGRNADGRRSRDVRWIYVGLLLVPLIVGMVWLTTWIGGASTYDRPFTIGERLLTEARVLLDYIRWTLLPVPGELSFYHDDISVSAGWLSPASTLFSVVILAALGAIAWWQRRKRPLLCLGILWFFAAHALTGTVIPLELAFEHRNYFASIGLLLSCASLIALEPGLASPAIRTTITLSALALFAFNTGLRATEWSDPLRFAVAEAAKRPLSPRAQYGLADTLMSHAQAGDSELTAKAMDLLRASSALPNAGITGEQGLIVYASALKQPVDPAWWKALTEKLEHSPPSESDIVGLRALFKCQLRGICQNDQTMPLLKAFLAALSHPNPRAPLLAAYADFAAVRLNDNALAEQALRSAIAIDPHESLYRSNLVRLLIAEGKPAQARKELASLRSLNRWGSLDATLEMLSNQLRAAEAESAHPSGSSSAAPPEKEQAG